MPDLPDPNNSISGADDSPQEQPSLREIAEQAYDDSSPPETAETPSDGRVRDERGRFVPGRQAGKDTRSGEAEPEAPSPETKTEAPRPDDPAAAARSNQPPDHWSAEDRALFQKLPPEAQSMLQRRYTEMEADYTRKSQANASAVQTVNALAPIFNDPDIQRSMQELGTHPLGVIQQWASFHKRGISPRVEDRASLMIDLAEQMGFDPARLFATNRPPEPPPLPPGVPDDPAVRHFANQFSRTAGEVQALRNEIQGIRAAEQQKFDQERQRLVRADIDRWADEKGADGKPLRPDFNDHLQYMLKLYAADPNIDMAEAYDTARRMNPKTWEDMVAAEKARILQQQSLDRAKAANRGNLRGVTSPVSKPTAKSGNGTLRDILDASADEVGY